MGLKSEKTVIQGTGYEVTQLPYKIGHRLLIRLYKLLGPALAEAMSKAPSIGPDTSLMAVEIQDIAPAFSAAVQSLADSLSEEDFDWVVESLAEYTKISLEADKWIPLKTQMEFHYSGNYLELFQWLGFALKVNFGGFIGGQGSLAALLAKAKGAVPA